MPSINLDDYIEFVNSCTDIGKLRAELIERMRVNVGLIAENSELHRRIRQLEEGR